MHESLMKSIESFKLDFKLKSVTKEATRQELSQNNVDSNNLLKNSLISRRKLISLFTLT